MRDTERLVLRQLGELDADALEPRERAFAADQQLARLRLPPAAEAIRGCSRATLRAVFGKRAAISSSRARTARAPSQRCRGCARSASRDRAEARRACRRQPRVDGEHAIDHVAVGERARAARVVAAMPPSVACAEVETSTGIPEARAASARAFSVSSTLPGSTTACRAVRVDLEHAIQVLAVVDHERLAHGLAALRGAARRAAAPARPRSAAICIAAIAASARARDHHAHRRHLVDRRIGRVAPAGAGIEQHLAVDLAREALREGRRDVPRRVRSARAAIWGWSWELLPECVPNGSRLRHYDSRMIAIARRPPCPPAAISCRSPARPTCPIACCARSTGRPSTIAGRSSRQLGKEVLDGMKRDLPDHATRSSSIPRRAPARGKRRSSTRSRRGDKVLMAETGHFASLWHKMAKKLGLDVEFIPGDWRHGADHARDRGAPRGGQGARDQGGRASSTTRPRPASPRASRWCARRSTTRSIRRCCMVDTISSLGSIDYRHDEWGVDVTVGGSQKGLMLPPGLCSTRSRRRRSQRRKTARLAALVLGLGRDAGAERERLLPLHAGHQPALRPARSDRACSRRKASPTCSRATTAMRRPRAARCAPGASRSSARSRPNTARRSPR